MGSSGSSFDQRSLQSSIQLQWSKNLHVAKKNSGGIGALRWIPIFQIVII
jgi:hypothetical protein